MLLPHASYDASPEAVFPHCSASPEAEIFDIKGKCCFQKSRTTKRFLGENFDYAASPEAAFFDLK
jgi:hypothetical protein